MPRLIPVFFAPISFEGGIDREWAVIRSQNVSIEKEQWTLYKPYGCCSRANDHRMFSSTRPPYFFRK